MWTLALRKLKGSLQLPICIINGAVSSTTIAQHQRDDANPSIKQPFMVECFGVIGHQRFQHPLAMIWHQGEADIITDITVKEYADFFAELHQDWKEDYHPQLPLIVVQVHTAACYSETLMSLRIANLQRTLGNYQGIHFGNCQWRDSG